MLVYDVEVLRGPQLVEGGWSNPEGMGFGTAVVYDSDADLYRFFGPEDRGGLIAILSAGPTVISFNGIKFDNRVILGNDSWLPDREQLWRNLDLLLLVIQHKFGLDSVKAAENKLGDKEVHDGSIGLDKLCLSTFGMGKTGHGAHAPDLIRDEDWANVFAYNLNDVRLTWKLAEFIRRYGYVVDGHGTKIAIPKEKIR